MALSDSDWLERIPKIELHVHLEGAVPLDAMWELISKYGGAPSIATLEDLRCRFICCDLPCFLANWTWRNGFLREYEDFVFVAEVVGRSLASQNVHYVEMFCSPIHFCRHGLIFERIVESIRVGLDRAPGIEIALIVDLVRDSTALTAALQLERIEPVRSCGVIGVGLGGNETRYPGVHFARVFERARELDFGTTVHAGEDAGAESVRSAVEDLKVDRVGHAARAIEDQSLVAMLAERRVALELCPISNVCTGVVRSLRQHPVRSYFDRGLLVTVNTDDPAIFHTSLAREYQALRSELGFTRDEIVNLVLNAIEASWMPAERKHLMRTRFGLEIAALG